MLVFIVIFVHSFRLSFVDLFTDFVNIFRGLRHINRRLDVTFVVFAACLSTVNLCHPRCFD